MSAILFKYANFINTDGFIQNGHIAIQDEIIRFIFPNDTEPEKDNIFTEVMDASSYLILPGLMNCHTHVPMTLFRGLGEDLPLSEWLNLKIFPYEDRLFSEAVYFGSLLAIAEMLHSGCTFFADMYFFLEDIAKACLDAGIKANLSLGLMDINGENKVEQCRELFAQFQNPGYEKLSFSLGPHAPYTCSIKYLENIVSLSHELDTYIHIHLNETLSEVEKIYHETGYRPIELMNQIGLFNRPTIAAHCVHTSEKERQILREHTILVVHNPSSNCKLSSGIAPIHDYLHRGIRLALGTDGAASNNQLNLFHEIRLASMLCKVASMDATTFPQKEFYTLLVKNPSSFFFPNQKAGIQPGGKADLIFVQTNHAHLYPKESLLSHLIYTVQGNEVEHVMINGEWIMQDKCIKTFDEKILRKEFSKVFKRITIC